MINNRSTIYLAIKLLCRGLIVALIVGIHALLLQPQIAKAHGGVIMDGGFTPEYEWLVLSANTPLVEGPNLMSFVIYDIDTYAPVDGMRVEVLIAHQSSEVQCCNPDDHVGPIELEADPENWPGDYSYELPLDGFGNFEIKFIAYQGDSDEPAIEAISNMLVLPDLSKITPEPNPNQTGTINSPLAAPGQPESPLETATDESTTTVLVTATLTTTAIATTSEPTSESIQAAGSGGTTAAVSTTDGDTLLDQLRNQWILWSAAALIPLGLLAFLLFRPSMDELVAQKEAELAAGSEDDLEDELDD